MKVYIERKHLRQNLQYIAEHTKNVICVAHH